MMSPNKIRSVLDILFMILALAAIITYFVTKDDFKVLIYVCDAVTFVKLMELFIQFTNRQVSKLLCFQARET